MKSQTTILPHSENLPPTNTQFTDLGKEAAIAGAIAKGTFELIPAHALVPVDAFVETKWRIVYSVAVSMRSRPSETIICEQSVNDWIALHDLDEQLQRAIDPTRTISWRAWPQGADTSLAFGENFRPLEYCLQELGELLRLRQEENIRQALGEHAIDFPEAIESWQALQAPKSNGTLPEIVSAPQFFAQPPRTPPEIIEGILHQGGKMCFGGGSKSFKTWTLLELSICIATGSPWLGFATTCVPVLYVNFELPAFAMYARLRDITTAMDIPIPEKLCVWNLRGYASDASIILPIIAKEAKKQNFRLLILDPLYKLLGSRDENASRDMADLMNRIEHLGVDIDSAIAFGSHFAKGNASLKESIDRISGSGVFARDPDSIVTLTQHEQPNAFAVDMTLRNFPQQDPFVVRRQHPLMVVDSKLDPAKLKKPKTTMGRPPEHEPDDLLDSLNGAMTSAEWLRAADVPERTFYRLRTVLHKEGRIFKSKIDHKWSRK